jgi:thiosulfate/3-mercaptopyruvate sulfurtransferase
MTLWSVATLHVQRNDPRLRVVDVRWTLGQPGAGRAAYDVGHLPGAIHLDLDTDLADHAGYGAPGRHPLPDPGAFATRLGALGIGSRDTVVAYDDVGGGYAARLWWMLDDLGHADVHVLDGGIGAWLAAGLPLTTDAPAWPPTRLELADRWSSVIDRRALNERLGNVVVLDARAPERYRGEVEPIDPVAGHIPTARNAPTAGNLGPDGRFRAPEGLAARFAGLGAGLSERGGSGSGGSEPEGSDVVTSCGSGITACQNALAMRLAGLPAPLLYVGSYSDWSRSGMPVVTGPAPGDPPA